MKHTATDDGVAHGLLPIDLPCQRETGAGLELEQFLQMRWRMTAALLRSELRKDKASAHNFKSDALSATNHNVLEESS